MSDLQTQLDSAVLLVTENNDWHLRELLLNLNNGIRSLKLSAVIVPLYLDDLEVCQLDIRTFLDEKVISWTDEDARKVFYAYIVTEQELLEVNTDELILDGVDKTQIHLAFAGFKPKIGEFDIFID